MKITRESKHKIHPSSVVLVGFLLLFTIAIVSAIFTSDDVDELCDTPSSSLYRNNTQWDCLESSYAEIWFHNDSGLSLGTLNSTYQTLNIFESSTSEREVLGFIAKSNELQLMVDGGKYIVTWDLTISGTNNHEYHAGIFINGVQDYGTNDHVIASAGDWARLGTTSIITLNKYDNVSIAIRDIGGTSAGTVYLAKLNLIKVVE